MASVHTVLITVVQGKGTGQTQRDLCPGILSQDYEGWVQRDPELDFSSIPSYLIVLNGIVIQKFVQSCLDIPGNKFHSLTKKVP